MATTDTPIKRKTQRFGYIPDLPDHRDHYYCVEAPIDLLPKVDLRAKMPLVYNQGDLGSCTTNALGAMCQYELMLKNPNAPIPSRLFVYWNERDIIHQTDNDSGSTLRDGIRTLAWYGFCDEAVWPYDISKFTVKPSAEAYKDAEPMKIHDYRRVKQTLKDTRTCLTEGNLVVIGIMVYESFMSQEVAKTGIVPMPKLNETEEGGHAVVMVGYDDAKQSFIVRNSWGPKWGDKGYFYLPYEYVMNPDLCADMWTIRTLPDLSAVEQGAKS